MKNMVFGPIVKVDYRQITIKQMRDWTVEFKGWINSWNSLPAYLPLSLLYVNVYAK